MRGRARASASRCSGGSASYTRFRRASEEGRLVRADEVRAEDFIGYHATADAPRPPVGAGAEAPIFLDARAGAPTIAEDSGHVPLMISLRGGVAAYRANEVQINPNYRAFINRETGEYELTETRNGFVAIINDLHKGRDTGKTWSFMIDLSAVLMTLVSLTGMVLLWFVKRRRFSGFILAGIGAVVCYLIYLFLIP